MKESAVVFDCDNEPLVGIIHEPKNPALSTVGVIIIVAGGPQYRVGAHRQFVALGRQLAQRNIPALRFDHRGTGDSGGEYRGFLDMNDDIESAVDVLLKRFPQLQQIALWGECESASAAAFYAHRDSRITGVFLVNPWIRTEAGQAKTYLKHYYLKRLRDPKFWVKIKSGEFSPIRSVKSYLHLRSHVKKKEPSVNLRAEKLENFPLPERLTKSLQLFKGEIFVLTSGNDYIAQEFKDFTSSSNLWKNSGINEKMSFYDMADADHTFSRTEWRTDLFKHTEDWLLS
ncbi:MAG: exosortase A-associated hydrolase 1 [Arenicella sp.]|jgi:exosortase A-associated hydrolase 1